MDILSSIDDVTSSLRFLWWQSFLIFLQVHVGAVAWYRSLLEFRWSFGRIAFVRTRSIRQGLARFDHLCPSHLHRSRWIEIQKDTVEIEPVSCVLHPRFDRILQARLSPMLIEWRVWHSPSVVMFSNVNIWSSIRVATWISNINWF